MKKLTLTTLVLLFSLGLTYRAYGLYGWFTASSLTYYTTATCDHPIYNCTNWQERHWRVNWSSSIPGPCNGQAPQWKNYAGVWSNVTEGGWVTGLKYQLTKTWMAERLCLNNVTCGMCTENPGSGCAASRFRAYCYFN